MAQITYQDDAPAPIEALVSLLSDIPGVTDTPLLARLVDGTAGLDFDLEMLGSTAKQKSQLGPSAKAIEAGRKFRTVARRLKRDALHFMAVSAPHPTLDFPALVVAELMRVPGDEANEISAKSIELGGRIADALELIANWPLPNNYGKGGKATIDDAMLRVVLGIAYYCDAKKIRFTGPRLEKADGKKQHIIKSPASILVAAVLERLQLPWEASELGTYMSKARALAKQNPRKKAEV